MQGALQLGDRAPTKLRKRMEREGQGKRAKRRLRGKGGGRPMSGMSKERGSKEERAGQGQAGGKWYLEDFSTGPGNTKSMIGRYNHGQGSGASGVHGCKEEQRRKCG